MVGPAALRRLSLRGDAARATPKAPPSAPWMGKKQAEDTETAATSEKNAYVSLHRGRDILTNVFFLKLCFIASGNRWIQHTAYVRYVSEAMLLISTVSGTFYILLFHNEENYIELDTVSSAWIGRGNFMWFGHVSSMICCTARWPDVPHRDT